MIVKVKGIAYDMSGSPIILLTDPTEQRVLPIWVGLLEAHSIALAMEGIPKNRPMTHDITLTICNTLGASITGVEICDLKDNTYFAELYISSGKDKYLIDVRPSDAIALALRAGLPINISQSLQGQMLDIQEIIDEDAKKVLEELSDNLLDEYKKSLH
ncbi:bifunctional nuclease family protein [Desulfoscipio sp. XC116]|uniref:bifunctional nuclease family protein n=1 Tax=Desulfoscipio sp. XC116 TaxID=3144975 RepID=UPI00325C3037